VWGTGWHPYAEKEWSPAGIEFLAVRGPITRDYILSNGGACPELYGDPAELLPQLYKPKVESNSSMGIVAHIFDDVGKSFFGNQINVSDPKWPKTIDKIASCKIIASSALHGIIIAEAYGIPAIWVKCSEHEAKYKEYFEVTGRPDAKPVEWSDVLDADPLPPPVKRDLTPFLNALRNRFGE
jgi:pyruvyltransferase